MFGPYNIAHPNEAAGNGLHPLPPLIRDPPKNATGESESQRAISSLESAKNTCVRASGMSSSNRRAVVNP